MNKFIVTAISLLIMNTITAQNPLLEPFNTPHGTIPFDRIKTEHFEPAIREGIKRHDAEIQAILTNPSKPNFENTILAYERSGQLLGIISSTFSNLLSADTNDDMQKAAKVIMPLLSEHSNNVSLNEDLFKRVKTVHDNQAAEHLNPEQTKLLNDMYKGFVRRGANLEGAAKERYRAISQQLSLLTIQFGENLLNATNAYTLNITDKKDLQGLPQTAIDAAAETAKEKGQQGWTFTLQYPSYSPFMMYAENRQLRQDLYMAYSTRCCKGGDQDNRNIIRDIVNLRMEMGQLLGFKDYAEYVLQERMAQNADNVNKLLNQLLDAYKPTATKEVAEIQDLARKENGKDFQLMPWDFSYYSHKLKELKYSIDDEQMRPYFELSQVRKGIFGLATKLYGITFKPAPDIPVYNKDVEAFEVYDKDGKFLAVFYADFYPRTGKGSGAWMTNYDGQWKDEKTGEDHRPQIAIVTNFTKPTADKPALLTPYEVETFIHEFGHSLHGMFSNVTYESLCSPNVYWDFVELPSQIMENFVPEKDFLNTFARHYKTGGKIPAKLVEKLKKAENFNVAYACLRQLSFGMLDMSWYTRTTPFGGDVETYENAAWAPTQLMPHIPGTCMSVQFSHIFDGGYAAGYYSYKWAEVLDADAFSLFKEKGIFNTDVANSFRENILSKGSTEHPMVLYKRFRGQEPTIDALLERNGIKK